MILGCHLSVSSLEEMSLVAKSLNINTFQFFLRSPQSMNSKQRIFKIDDLNYFNNINNKEIFNVLGHAPFVANAASSKEFVRETAEAIIRQDLNSLNPVKNSLYVFHPGAHVGDGVSIGIQRISDMINNVLNEKQETILLLETMSGKGTEIGGKFEELGSIIENVKVKDKIGVCLDTCHIWDAGYDLRDLDKVLEEFDSKIGLKYLKAIHLNNSLNDVGSHKDRHANLYNGKIDKDTIKAIITHPKLKDIPFYLETPIESVDDYLKDIKFINELLGE